MWNVFPQQKVNCPPGEAGKEGWRLYCSFSALSVFRLWEKAHLEFLSYTTNKGIQDCQDGVPHLGGKPILIWGFPDDNHCLANQMYLESECGAIPLPSFKTNTINILYTLKRASQVAHSLSRCFSPVRLFATPSTVAHWALLSTEFSRQEYWSGLPFPSPGDLPDPGNQTWVPALQTLYLLSHQGIPSGAHGEGPSCQCRRHKRRGFNPWVGKIPWRRAWESTPVFFTWIQELGRLQSIGSQRVGQDWVTNTHTHTLKSFPGWGLVLRPETSAEAFIVSS